MSNIFCKGVECPVKKSCLRYTKYITVTQCIGGYTVIRKCTNQHRFLQDENNINQDGKRK